MSLRLPLAGSPERALFEVSDLVAAHERGYAGMEYRAVIGRAKAYIQSEPNAISLNVLTLRANGELWLVEVYKDSTVLLRWNFGNVYPEAA